MFEEGRMEKMFYLRRWPAVREGLLQLVTAFEPEDLTHPPIKGGWPLGRIILHISSAANFWLHSGILSPNNVYRPGESTLDNYPTMDAVRTFLAEEHERTMILLKGFDEADWERRFSYPDGHAYSPSWVFWHVLEHEIHHRGELSLALGQLGRGGLDV